MNNFKSKKLLFSLIFFLVSFFLLSNSPKNKQKVLGTKAQSYSEAGSIHKVEQILKNNQNYRDGWLWLSFLYLKENRISQARDCLKRAKIIDPNNQKINKMLEILETNYGNQLSS